MRLLGIPDIEDIVLGAALLGAGGGGDPYVGKLTAMAAVKECGPVKLIGIDEIPEDGLVVPIASVGAPTVLTEKGCGRDEYRRLLDTIERYCGKKACAVMPIEAGGVNSMLPIAAAARLGLPMVDADAMGRAFPEIQMVTFTIGGIPASPMVFVDEKGNLSIIETITNKWTETLCRAGVSVSGGSVISAEFMVNAAQLREYAVDGIVTYSQQLGRSIREIKRCPAGMTPEENFLKVTGGHRIFKGKISDVLRETRDGFNFGRVMLEGIADCKGSQAFVEFQNENLCAVVDGDILATAPDLICLVDTDTFTPVPTDALKYGKRVLVVGLECFHLWRTPEGLDLVGPRYFGIDTDYVPVEKRCKQGSQEDICTNSVSM